MSQKDREKWDEKYRNDFGDTEPSKIVRDYIQLAPKGRALDLASGKGRNSLFLALQGFEVDAVDVSTVAVDAMKDLHPRLHARCEDLDTWDLPQQQYDLIVSIRFLDQRLFPRIIEALKPGGMLIFESFLEKTQLTGESCHNPKYLLSHNELLHAFLPLRIVFYREETRQEGEEAIVSMASLVAFKR